MTRLYAVVQAGYVGPERYASREEAQAEADMAEDYGDGAATVVALRAQPPEVEAYTVSHYGEVEPVTWKTGCDLTVEELCSAVCRVLRLSENGPTCHALAAAFERRWGGTYSPLALPTIRAHIAAILALARGPGLDTGRATRVDYALLSWCSASSEGRRYLGYLPRWERSCYAHVPTIRTQVRALQAEIARLEAGMADERYCAERIAWA